ncbi:unnamed protein product [Lymnaea stagnalis]|uniref:A-kinase anchor protein 7-like phosphoesterase domain-containing protein n=1 Tax=Lymnaea stagnalis TaxID=6523 RepID=A0AAV2HZF3_LYMST
MKIKMSEKDCEHPQSSYIVEDGKRNILPLHLLRNLKSLVRDKSITVAQQIIESESSNPVCEVLTSDSKQTDDQSNPCTDDNKSSCLSLSKSDCECARPAIQYASQDVIDNVSRQVYIKGDDAKPIKQDSNNNSHADRERQGRIRKAGEISGLPEKKRKRPNFFVAVQITDAEIHSAAKLVQSAIQDSCKCDIQAAVVGSEKFHITLMVMNLSNEEELTKATDTLDNCVSPILERTSGEQVTLPIEGVSAFNGGKVLFAQVKQSSGLDYLQFMADEVDRQMEENGISSTDIPKRPFQPHMTLLKFGQKRDLYKKGVRKVSSDQYEPFVNQVFGSQVITSLQLCCMDKRREDGYYFVNHEVPLKVMQDG